MIKFFFDQLLHISQTLESMHLVLIIVVLISVIWACYAAGSMDLGLVLYLCIRAFIVLVSSKAFFRLFRVALRKSRFVAVNIAFYPYFFICFALGLFGLEAGLLLAAFEIAEAFSETAQPGEVERDQFEGTEEVEPGPETETDDIEEEKPDAYGVWPGVALLVAIKIALLVWFY